MLPLAVAAVSGLVCIGLATLVFVRNPQGTVNRSFALVALAIGFWNISLYQYVYPLVWDSFQWIKITYTWVPVMLFGLIYFSYVFPSGEAPSRRLVAFFVLSNLAVLWLIHGTSSVVESVIMTPQGPFTQVGPWYWTLSVLWGGFITLSLVRILLAFRRSTGLPKLQSLYVFWGLAIFFAGTVLFDGIVPVVWHTTMLYQYSGIGSLFFVILTTYAIARHRLMDIKLILVRIVSYFSALAVIEFLFIMALIVVGQRLFGYRFSMSDITLLTLCALVISTVLNPLRRWFEHRTSGVFHISHYRIDDLLSDFNRDSSVAPDIMDLSRSTLSLIRRNMQSEWAGLEITGNGRTYAMTLRGQERTDTNRIGINADLMDPLPDICLRAELPESPVKQYLRKHDITLTVRLHDATLNLGYLFLGDKASGDVYYTTDLHALEILAPEIVLAIRNALSYAQIKQFNQTLQDRIDEATRKLMDANEHLKIADSLKDEFVATASHDLRTPLTSIKGYLWLALKQKGQLPEKTVEHLTRAYNSAERMHGIISDMLDLNKIESGKMELMMEKVDLNAETADIIGEMAVLAQEKGISIASAPATVPLFAYADRARMHEILVNLIDNAIKYTPQGGRIIVCVQDFDDMVMINVCDTGIGISPDNVTMLFTKFGRLRTDTEPMSKARGTGLGLYICKRIVELSGGEIGIDSIPGRGSTFHFTLPKYGDGQPQSTQTALT